MLGFRGNRGGWAVILLAVLDNLGFDVTTLVTGLGIGGIASRSPCKMCSATFSLRCRSCSTSRSCRGLHSGRWLLGTVEQIGLRRRDTQPLRRADHFANGELLKGASQLQRPIRRRNVFSIDVSHATPTASSRAFGHAPQIARVTAAGAVRSQPLQRVYGLGTALRDGVFRARSGLHKHMASAGDLPFSARPLPPRRHRVRLPDARACTRTRVGT